MRYGEARAALAGLEVGRVRVPSGGIIDVDDLADGDLALVSGSFMRTARGALRAAVDEVERVSERLMNAGEAVVDLALSYHIADGHHELPEGPGLSLKRCGHYTCRKALAERDRIQEAIPDHIERFFERLADIAGERAVHRSVGEK